MNSHIVPADKPIKKPGDKDQINKKSHFDALVGKQLIEQQQDIIADMNETNYKPATLDEMVSAYQSLGKVGKKVFHEGLKKRGLVLPKEFISNSK